MTTQEMEIVDGITFDLIVGMMDVQDAINQVQYAKYLEAGLEQYRERKYLEEKLKGRN